MGAENRTIVRMKFGSHLYGTATPASDLDFKSVFVPDARSILLQKVKGSISHQRPKGIGEKNFAGEDDEEQFSIQRFLGLAAEGQTVALDMLFALESAMLGDQAWEWREITANRHRLLTSKSAAFVGYARTQANKFGVKGTRVSASRAALAILEQGMADHGTTAKLLVLADKIAALLEKHEHMAIAENTTPTGQTIQLWEVCNRKIPYTASIKNAHEIVARVVDEYGRRALMAETQQGADWKALSHAIRVSEQAIELLETGHVTLPLRRADHIRSVKLGEVPYKAVADEIDELLLKVEVAAEKSALPAKPDYAWIDAFVEEVHRKSVIDAALS